MKGRLIPAGRTIAAHVVSVDDEGRYRPLAAFADHQDAHQIAKLIGMSEPSLHPRIDRIWMPADSFRPKRGRTAKKANGMH